MLNKICCGERITSTMKLRLPLSLRLALTAVFWAAAPSTTYAAIMHSQVSLLTYTDFGQNRGRYSAGNVNALLQHIREVEGGVRINYQDGRDPTPCNTA